MVLARSLQRPSSAQDDMPTDDEVNADRQASCIVPFARARRWMFARPRRARQWRELIRTMLAEGKSEDEIKQYFVDAVRRARAERAAQKACWLIVSRAGRRHSWSGAFMLFRGVQDVDSKPAAAEPAAFRDGVKRRVVPQDELHPPAWKKN
ncbi:MAG: hypothetical protein MZV64_19810 [Ignavibacteriales bacterium]|nr:hypothetical protein [Ignavibacteriales bacterium]